MGALLDSTFLIAAEPRGHDAITTLRDARALVGNDVVAISVVSVMELTHGAIRADTMLRRLSREDYLADLLRAVPVHVVDSEIAMRAGRLDASLGSQGRRLAMADLLIAATALELGYRVVTANVRHFERVPGLSLLVT